MGRWFRPTQHAPVNIYEGMVTHNVTEPTYTVDEVGWPLAFHPAARARSAVPIGMDRPETPIASPRQPVGMRTWDKDGNPIIVHQLPARQAPKGFRNG